MKKTMFRRFAAVLLTLLMALSTLVPAFAADAKAIPGTVTTQVNAGFVNVTSEYIALNALRREPFVSQLNADNFTRTFYNTTPFDQLPVLMYNTELEKAAKVRAKEIVQLFSHTRKRPRRSVPRRSSSSSATPVRTDSAASPRTRRCVPSVRTSPAARAP